MKPILVVFAAPEGQSCRIAHHIAKVLQLRGLWTRLHNVHEIRGFSSLYNYSAVILVAAVYGRRHEQAMVSFVEQYRSELAALPSALLSVSHSDAGTGDAGQDAEQRAEASAEMEKLLEDLLADAGWRPGDIFPVGGALRCSQLGTMVSFVMKRLPQHAGASRDASRDRMRTSWAAIDAFLSTFLRALVWGPPASAVSQSAAIAHAAL